MDNKGLRLIVEDIQEPHMIETRTTPENPQCNLLLQSVTHWSIIWSSIQFMVLFPNFPSINRMRMLENLKTYNAWFEALQGQ